MVEITLSKRLIQAFKLSSLQILSEKSNTISLLMPLPIEVKVDNKFCSLLRQTCESLLAQGIDRWELVIGASAQQQKKIANWLCHFLSNVNSNKRRFRLITCQIDNQTKALNIKKLAQDSKGDWVGFAFVGDRFASHFVYECLMRANKRPSVKVIYFDDDILKNISEKQNISGQHRFSRFKPHFKPDFSPDLLYSFNYIGLSFVVKRESLMQVFVGRWQQSLNFSMQLVLALTKNAMQAQSKGASTRPLPSWHNNHPIQHVSQVLRHKALNVVGGSQSFQHETSKSAALEAKRLVSAYLNDMYDIDQVDFVACIKPNVNQVAKLDERGGMRVLWPLPQLTPKVSIIVPTKDHFSILKVCIDSLIAKTTYSNYEILVVDNQTTQTSALKYMANLLKREPRVRVLKYNKPFNYSDMNNQAVAQCDGDVLLFLNNDVEILDGDWLTEMVRHAARAEVGCVGAKLLYPDYTIQHGGVALGMHGVADHMYRGLEDSAEADPYGYLHCVRNTGAVTGAVLAVRRSVFEAVGRFDAKKLPVAFNDVDLCLKAEVAGFRTVWTPYAYLIHHESKTRAPQKVIVKNKKPAQPKIQSHATERSEIVHMKASWGPLLRHKFQALGQRYEPLRFL